MIDTEFRQEIIQTRGNSFFEGWGLDEDISNLQTYIDIVEYAIDEKEKKIFETLEKKTANIPEDKISEFWSLYYPYQFEDIVKVRARWSFFISIMSLLEFHLKKTCGVVTIISKHKLKSEDIAGSELEKAKKYLSIIGDFKTPENKYWEYIGNLQKLRNVFIHNNGILSHQIKKNGKSTEENLISFIKQAKHLSLNEHCMENQCMSFIKISEGFCKECLSFVDEFFELLKKEIYRLCKNAARFEGSQW